MVSGLCLPFSILGTVGSMVVYTGLVMRISEEERELFFFSIYVSNSMEELWLTLLDPHA